MDLAVVVAVCIGGVIAFFGLFIILMVWRDERRREARPRGGNADLDWPAVIQEFLRWIKSMTPKPYRLGVMLVAVGAAVILGSIALAA